MMFTLNEKPNLEKICHLCAESSSDIILIHPKKTEHKELREFLKNHLNLKISGINFPRRICGPCVAKIEEMNIFFKKCQNTQILLQEIALNSESQPQYVDMEFEPIEVTLIEADVNVSFSSPDAIIGENCFENSQDGLDQFYSFGSEFGDEDIQTKDTFDCSQCSKSYTNEKSLKYHVRTAHEELKESCPECSKVFRSGYLWSRHMKIHSGRRRISCSECPKVFSSERTLALHRKIHENNVESPSKFDNDSFSTIFRGKERLEASEERQNSTDAAPFVCDRCGKSFNTKGNLVVHSRIHSGSKPYECSACGKQYSNSGPFKVHLRSHSGEKPFVCDVCQKGFASPRLLKRHQLIHAGKYPFPCQFCGRGFRDHWKRKVHERIHTGERPYKCSLCPKAFCESGNLQKHFKKNHSPEKSEPDHALKHESIENTHIFTNEGIDYDMKQTELTVNLNDINRMNYEDNGVENNISSNPVGKRESSDMLLHHTIFSGNDLVIPNS